MAEAKKVTEEYCKPWCAGLASEPRAVGRRLGKLLDALDTIDRNSCEGGVTESAYNLKIEMLDKLRAEGWRITANDKWQVLPPK